MEERAIGATELRQKLTDVIQTIREERVAYVVETFGRPQVVVMDLREYRRLQAAQPASPAAQELARAAFGMWRERDDIDEMWLERVREPWQSAWKETESVDE
jgi:prevent-host-death family protein